LRSKQEGTTPSAVEGRNDSQREKPGRQAESSARSAAEPAGSGEEWIIEPLLQLPERIRRYEGAFPPEAARAELVAFEELLRKSRAEGRLPWGAEEWMKDESYYRELETTKLAEECFSRSIFMWELGLFDLDVRVGLVDPHKGWTRLKIMHNGFRELARREDMWKGILHIYDYLGARLLTAEDLITLVEAVGTLARLCDLYQIDEFKRQVKVPGREMLFLKANLKTLEQFRRCIDTSVPSKLGTTLGFYCEPADIAQVTLLLLKQVDPEQFAEVAPRLQRVRWRREQKLEDVRDLVDMVLRTVKLTSQ
jgi:hypothetical protein